jgi:hypothetical protein
LASEAIVIAAGLLSCGGAGMSGEAVPFTDHGSTQQSANDNGRLIVAAADPAQTGLGQLARKEDGRLYIAVFAGAQRTGGYAVRVVGIERSGDLFFVRAAFTVPPSGALTIQVLTSPAQLVSISSRAVGTARDLVLTDESGAEQARTRVPQSQP